MAAYLPTRTSASSTVPLVPRRAHESAPTYSPYTRPTGFVVGTAIAYPAILLDRPAVTHYQRILMGLGFSVGPHNADGWGGDDTVAAVRRFQTWHNSQPVAGRGDTLRVDGLLGPDTQRALQRFASRAADRVVLQAPVADWGTAPPVEAPTPTAVASRPPSPAGQGVPVTPIGVPVTPIGATWGGGSSAHSFLDPAGLGATQQVLANGLPAVRDLIPVTQPQPATFPWVAITATAATLAALVAVARYYHERKAATR